MSPPTVAILAAGSMGSAVASRLTHHGITVLTSLHDRSPSTRKRALEAGMQDIPFAEMSRKASLFLSILPPSEAESIAKDYIRAHSADTTYLEGDERIYVDCNAVSPQTVKRIAKIFEGVRGVRFVDAGIIGGPPKDGYDPTFYASSDDVKALERFEGLSEFGMKITGMRGEGAGVGDASALKMSYAVRLYYLVVISLLRGEALNGVASFPGHNEGPYGPFYHYDPLYAPFPTIILYQRWTRLSLPSSLSPLVIPLFSRPLPSS